nr:unnamed protein product [Callosobruchus analis]
MSKHPESAVNYNLSICVHCNATYKSKKNLDDHIIRKHPDFIESISSKIHECTHCTYKTTVKGHLTEHMVQHTETADIYKLRCIHCDETFKQTADSGQLITCTHCEAKFKSKQKLDEHTLKKHPDLIASVSSKIHECIYCTYKTTREDHPEAEDSYQHSTCIHCNAVFKRKRNLDDHIVRKHPDFIAFVSTADIYMLRCLHCEATFKRKTGLDNHVIRKHPHFIASVSSKMHECTYCTYKTTMKSNFAKHMLKHPETANQCKFSICVQCKATFKSRPALDDHTLKKHPESIGSVASKNIYECTQCTFKTVKRTDLARHMLKHPEAADRCKFSVCVHCNATFKKKGKLDEHTVRKHPHLIASVTNKIHECTRCAFKTVMKASLARHVMKHPEIADSNKLIRCNHCNSTFKSKPALNDHIINRHPDFMASISSKIHQCKYCTYKTTWKSHFARHMLAHPETADSRKLSKCIRCNTEYKHKIGLDEHILRQHPELIASVSNKMHECTHCAFKTVFKSYLTRHMLKHPETADRCKFSACVHCNATFKSKPSLVDHTLRKHPDSVESNSIRIYECTHCAYKTCLKRSFTKHILKHP